MRGFEPHRQEGRLQTAQLPRRLSKCPLAVRGGSWHLESSSRDSMQQAGRALPAGFATGADPAPVAPTLQLRQSPPLSQAPTPWPQPHLSSRTRENSRLSWQGQHLRFHTSHIRATVLLACPSGGV